MKETVDRMANERRGKLIEFKINVIKYSFFSRFFSWIILEGVFYQKFLLWVQQEFLPRYPQFSMCLFRTFYTFHSQKFFPRFFQHLSKFMQKPDFCSNSMNDINKISTIFRIFSRVTHKFSQTFFSELVNRFLHIFIQVHLGFQPGISSEIRLGIPSRYFVSKYSKNWQFFWKSPIMFLRDSFRRSWRSSTSHS